jgi:peptidoglycan/LPS O-acetylase OafA/YrhL
MVVAYHAGLPMPGGFTGVDVFFAISGFVITAMLADELRRTGRLRLANFYARRVKRLLPALALMVSVVAALDALLGPAASNYETGKTGVFASVFAANAYFVHAGTGYFETNASLNPFLHTWTLAVEEQFYLFFPALLLITWRIRKSATESARRAASVAAIALVCALSLALAVRLSGGSVSLVTANQRFSFYGSPTRAWEFGAGAVVALLIPWLSRLHLAVASTLAVAGLASILVGAFIIHATANFPGWPTLLPVGGACALLMAGTSGGGVASNWLGMKPAVWIGDLSYSWYLWHWPLIVFGHALWPGLQHVGLFAAGLSLIPAWISYRHVENPIRFRAGLAKYRVLALAVICITIPIIASLSEIKIETALASRGAVKSWRDSQIAHPSCDRTISNVAASPCFWVAPRARGTIVLVGDSNAWHFTEPFLQAARKAHLTAAVADSGGCPFADVLVVGPVYGERPCRESYTTNMNGILALHPALVVIANRTDLYINETAEGLGQAPDGAIAFGKREKTQVLTHGLAQTLRRLTDAGIPVVVVHPVPAVPTPPQGCAVLLILTGRCGSSTSETQANKELQTAIAIENRAIAFIPGTAAVNFEKILCPNGRCSAQRGSTFVYFDSDHLSIQGALLLSGCFDKLAALSARTPHPRDPGVVFRGGRFAAIRRSC